MDEKVDEKMDEKNMSQVVLTQPTAKQDSQSDAEITPEEKEEKQTCLNFCCDLFFCEQYPQEIKKPSSESSTTANLGGAAFLAMGTLGAHRRHGYSDYDDTDGGHSYGADGGGGDGHCGGSDGDCGGGGDDCGGGDD